MESSALVAPADPSPLLWQAAEGGQAGTESGLLGTASRQPLALRQDLGKVPMSLLVGCLARCVLCLRGFQHSRGPPPARLGGLQSLASMLSMLSPQPGDKTLAQSAQMYHYQHQKQQMLSMEK